MLPVVVLFAWLLWIRRRPLREALVRSAVYTAVTLVVSIVVVAVFRECRRFHRRVILQLPRRRTLDQPSATGR